MRDVLRFMLGIGVLLLLLSALVTGGETDAVLPVPAPSAPRRCEMCVPRALRTEAETGTVSGRETPRPAWKSLPVIFAAVPAPDRETDANGRVLCKASYTESVYTLFDPERAAG